MIPASDAGGAPPSGEVFLGYLETGHFHAIATWELPGGTTPSSKQPAYFVPAVEDR